LFQIGFLEILIILILGLVIIGPKRLPVVVKNLLKLYRRMQNKFSNFRKEFEEEIGSEEINKDFLIKIGKISGNKPVKILGNGDLDKKFSIKVDAFSKSAENKIKSAGGSILKV